MGRVMLVVLACVTFGLMLFAQIKLFDVFAGRAHGFLKAVVLQPLLPFALMLLTGSADMWLRWLAHGDWGMAPMSWIVSDALMFAAFFGVIGGVAMSMRYELWVRRNVGVVV
jgi:hypothetical protein